MENKMKKSETALTIIFSVVLFIYIFSILCINIFAPETFYDTDMYSDMNYSAEVWTHKSIFPEGWVFGNQLYVVATPVLASVFYGITQNHTISMGLASSIYALLILLSFDWMLKPVLKKTHERLIAATTFLSVVLFAGDTYNLVNGWQLLFTMCSYYACYTVTVFLAFGCYLRSRERFNHRTNLIFVITCALSFATGIQSIRQTAVMVVPLFAVEFLRVVKSKILKQKLNTRPIYISSAFAICNVFGVLVSKIIAVNSHEIYGEMRFTPLSDLISAIVGSVYNIIDLFTTGNYIVSILIFIVIWSLVFLAAVKLTSGSSDGMKILLLFLFSIFTVFIVDIFISMQIWNKYYFMLFPLIAFVLAFLHSTSKYYGKIAIIGALIPLFLYNVFFGLYPTFQKIHYQNTDYQEISDYLEENGYTTVYSCWNIGEKIAIASDFKIQAGFYLSSGSLSDKVDYLCNPDIYDTEPNQCVYAFRGQESANKALNDAKEQNYTLHLIQYFENSDIYIFASEDPIMFSPHT